MKIKKMHTNPDYRLMIQVEDKSIEGFTTKDGAKYIYTKWIEVPEANLGSFKKGNKEILSIRLEPVKYEKEENKGRKKRIGIFHMGLEDNDE